MLDGVAERCSHSTSPSSLFLSQGTCYRLPWNLHVPVFKQEDVTEEVISGVPSTVAAILGLHAGRVAVQVNTLQPALTITSRPPAAPPLLVFLELFSGDRKTLMLFKEMGAVRSDGSNLVVDRSGFVGTRRHHIVGFEMGSAEIASARRYACRNLEYVLADGFPLPFERGGEYGVGSSVNDPGSTSAGVATATSSSERGRGSTTGSGGGLGGDNSAGGRAPKRTV